MTQVANEAVDVEVKLLIIGDPGVGKTSLLLRYIENSYTDNYMSTIGFDYKVKIVNINNTKVRVQIWDTAGQERFRIISSSYYRGAQGVIIAYDVTDKASFENMNYWFQDFEKYSLSYAKRILIGCKNDLENEREVDKEEGIEFAQRQGLKLFETSSKTANNIDESFTYLLNEILSPENVSNINITKRQRANTVSLSRSNSNVKPHSIDNPKNCQC